MRGLIFLVWNFAWDRLASRLYAATATTFLMKIYIYHPTRTNKSKSVIMLDYKQGKSEGFVSCDRPSNLTQIGFKSSIFQPVWLWNLMDDLEKLKGTSSSLHQALCIILNPSVNSNWSYCPEMLNSGENQRFIVPSSKFDWWPWKTTGHLFYVASSFVHHFIAIGEFKLKLQSGNAQFGSKSVIYCPVWPWNLTEDFEKQ